MEFRLLFRFLLTCQSCCRSGGAGPVGASGDVQGRSDVVAQPAAGRSQLHHHRLLQRTAVLHLRLHGCFSYQPCNYISLNVYLPSLPLGGANVLQMKMLPFAFNLQPHATSVSFCSPRQIICFASVPAATLWRGRAAEERLRSDAAASAAAAQTQIVRRGGPAVTCLWWAWP